MTPLYARVRARLAVLRTRHPRAAGRIEDVALAGLGRAALVSEVRTLRTRLRELERDHLLLAAHVATLTERTGRTTAAASEAGDEAARQRARLSAIAFYEERISRLERTATRRSASRRAERGPRRVSIGRTTGEPAGGER